jgi:hypothetical protein
MADSRLLAKMQRTAIDEALDIAERLGDGGLEEHFERARHYSAGREFRESVVVAGLAQVVVDLNRRVEELEAKPAKKSGASGKKSA